MSGPTGNFLLLGYKVLTNETPLATFDRIKRGCRSRDHSCGLRALEWAFRHIGETYLS